MQDAFRVFARVTSGILGSAWSFVVAIAVIVLWAASGHLFHYSDTWQLIINTGTTIVTFLMVFLIQNTQNRDAKAVHLKLDELIRAAGGARNHLVDIERLSDQELVKLQKEFEHIGKKADAASAAVERIKESPASS
ncbi:MAG TPA: low affinity iron permease family protein [Chthoniobacterales bacterium]|nr:low affinity iron permease family protein [Chthoniobacterales bacterium]